MSLFELVVSGTIANQQWVNRYNYVSEGTPGTVTPAYGLVYAFGGINTIPSPISWTWLDPSPLHAQRQAMAAGALILNILAFNVDNPVDFYSTPIVPGQAGAHNIGIVSPAVSFGIRSTQVRRDIKSGRKSIPGVYSTALEGDGNLTPGAIGEIQTLADELSRALTYTDEGSTLTFTPCIVGKEKLPVAGSDPETFAYYYYEDPAVQAEHLAVGITWNAVQSVRTQRSRQFGVGI